MSKLIFKATIKAGAKLDGQGFVDFIKWLNEVKHINWIDTHNVNVEGDPDGFFDHDRHNSKQSWIELVNEYNGR